MMNMVLANTAVKALQEQLRASPTALNPGAAPTAQDLNLSRQVRSAQSKQEIAFDDAKRKSVYGSEPPAAKSAAPTEKKVGPLERVLKALAVPVNVAAGVAETALGKGTETGLLENIKSNIDEGGAFGDILRSSGAPQIVAMPVGLALDIALDPLNWVSAGTGALVPRMFKGLAKGSGKGLAIGLKSGALQKAEGLLKVPGAKTGIDYAESVTKLLKKSFLRKAFEGGSEAPVTWSQRLARTTGLASREATDAYDRVVGDSVGELLRQGRDQKTFSEKIIDKVVKATESKLGKDNMEAIKAMAKYDEKGYFEKKLALSDEASKALESDFYDISKLPKLAQKREYEERKIIDRLNLNTHEGYDMMEGHLPTRASDANDFAVKAAAVGLDEVNQANLIRAQMTQFAEQVKNNPKAMEKLDLMSDDDKSQFFALFKNFGLSDVPAGTSSFIDSYNKGIASLLTSSKTTRNILETYEKGITAFKAMVIGTSVPAHVNAFVTNPFLLFTSGVNPFTDDYIRSGKDVVRALMSGNESDLLTVMDRELWSSVIEHQPEMIKGTLGINPLWLKYGPAYLKDSFDDMLKSLDEGGESYEDLMKLLKEDDEIKSVDEFKKAIQENLDYAQELMGKEAGLAKTKRLIKTLEEGPKAFSKIRKASGKEALKTFSTLEQVTSEDDTIAFGQEVMTGVSKKWLTELRKKEAAGDKIAGAIRFMIEEPMNLYGKHDQASKITTAVHLTKNGISEGEFKILNSWMKFAEDEVIRSDVGTYVKLTPLAALRVANEVALNYSALPAVPKVIRSMPLIGAPFFSFTYASGTRLLRAAHLNPGFYNKISFFLHEFQGEKDPLEKKALTNKYYSFLDKPEYVKIPFFKKNPIYLNVSQMVPHYSMKMLQSGERDYESEYGTEVAKWIDRFPMFQTPEGQLILNYLILPKLLGEALNQFGQPLYPENATPGQIAGTLFTAAADPFVPRTPSAIAGGTIGGFVPEEVTQYTPGYAFRKMRYGLLGKTAAGVKGKESPASRSIRNILSEVGLRTQKIDLTNQ